MKKERAYYENVDKKNEERLNEMLTTLPSFCKTFFRGIEHKTASRTRVAYAYDLGVFFDYMHDNNSMLKTMDIHNFPMSIFKL